MISLPKSERKTIQKLSKKAFSGACICKIEDKKPEWCKRYPYVDNVLPGCGYKFVYQNGGLVRVGNCSRCGQCCSHIRVDGEPLAPYHPKGKPCKYLEIVEW